MFINAVMTGRQSAEHQYIQAWDHVRETIIVLQFQILSMEKHCVIHCHSLRVRSLLRMEINVLIVRREKLCFITTMTVGI